MRLWSSKPQSVTARTLDSAAFKIITLLSIPSTPQFLLSFPGLFISFLHPPRPITYLRPSFTRRYRFSLSLYLLLSPHLDMEQSDHPPGWRPFLPASTACLRFPPLLRIPRSSLREPVSTFPRTVLPPFAVLVLSIRSLLAPGFSYPCVHFSLCLPPPSTRPPPSLPALTGIPVPCRSQVVASCSSLSLSPVLP